MSTIQYTLIRLFDFGVTQVITNLMANAVKFTPEGGEIRLHTFVTELYENGCELRVEVTDSGIGISPAAQEKLFDVFEQADAGTTKNREQPGGRFSWSNPNRGTNRGDGSLGCNFSMFAIKRASCYTRKMKKNINKKQIFLQLSLAICIVAVVIFAGMLIREVLINKQSQSFYNALSERVEIRPSNQENRPPGWFFVPYVDFGELGDIYPGIVGWIKSDSNLIDYPVMQYTNNNYFLEHLPDGSQHRSGSIFLDYRNKIDFSDKNILIYGHESREQEMFGSLKNYRNQSYYNENSIMYLYTPEADYEIVIFAVYLIDSQTDHPPLSFSDDDDFMGYIAQLKQISFINSDVVINSDDKIVSLCTCAYDFDEARLIVVGVLTER